MVNQSLISKIKLLIDIMKNNNYIIYVISILVATALLLFLSCKMNNKLKMILYIVIYTIIIGFLIYKYHQQILSLFDYLVECIVSNLLFPNLAVYISILLIINIIVVVTIFSKKIKNYIRSINIVAFLLMQLFLYLIVNNIIANNVNVYEKLSIYTNNDLLVLIELSMQLFVVWISVLEIVKLIDYLMTKSLNSTPINEQLVLNNDLSFEPINDSYYVDEENYYSDYLADEELIEYVPIKKKKYN